MQASSFLNVIALACAIGAAITVGRTGLLKQTITTQASLITALKDENAEYKAKIDKQDRRIEVLEAIIHANPGLVGAGYLAARGGGRRGNGAASAKSPKNRNP